MSVELECFLHDANSLQIYMGGGGGARTTITHPQIR